MSSEPAAAAAREASLLASLPSGLLIGGRWINATGDRTFAVQDPATGAALASAADASPSDAIDALTAADRAQKGWAAHSSRARSDILRRAFDLLTDRADDFALLIALEMGKSLKEARGEVAYAAEFLRWFSEEAAHVHGRYQVAPSSGLRHVISKRPVGPCLLITPWNFPLAMITRKVGPAVAAGCTMLLKPAELTPLTTLLFAALMQEAGLPDGVLNVITTSRSSEVIAPLLADGRLKKLSFTGSTHVGRILLAAASANILRTSMELGGNAPFLVFEDADLNAAVEGAMHAKLRNIGQACTAANRFYVHEAVADTFTQRLHARFSSLALGRGPDGADVVGPLISGKAREDVHRLVTEAIDEGATLVTGGAVPDGPGYFYPPTILCDIRPGSRIVTEEIFGPVATISRFASEQEAIEQANATEYGLASYAYTRDLGRALRLQEQIEAGMLGINTGLISDPAAPFGGIKHSGLGSEGGIEGIEEYLTTHYAGFGQVEIA
ncbi:NAD-dependent succinate-semialdehyde dehydrogenase [Sphingobium subterraneum]|uniref:Succinate-semialdehyde dehydrogenase/glutarate-semialdehyde dehydrogenase n=1 Tax=Sphingobium subterraneum TaxID=627688 RepID=A0A841IZ59_9SPHN|nr:NAD-dependent succinate-semialdehyde dehydrogenase [Sphingobium subterraneum]MBB6123620.1 succinate-semialdehyde dehydrogenase/glutarate-semialdehyde dehydrogenase [Sphingobium subterraneum]